MNNKKKFGQFFTNPKIASFMVNLAITDSTKTFLDPAVGPGIFIKKAYEVDKDICFTSFEVDRKMIEKYNKNISFPTNIINEDYLYSKLDKYDAIVCNPPYNKFQEIDDRKELITMYKKKYKINLSGYSNYCMYFLIKSLNELNKDGKCVYIIPYEFFNTGYGEQVKEYLLRTKMLKTIIKFDSNLKLFDDAMTTSCILVFEKNKHNTISFIDIKSMDDFNMVNEGNYSSVEILNYKYDDLNYKEKWSKYFRRKKHEFKNLIKFNEYAKVKRGIATGNNAFFNLNKSMINKYHLSDEVCIPCVTRCPDVQNLVMTDDYFRELVNNDKKLYIFDGRNKNTKGDLDYIVYGESIGVNKSYINSHRKPWYGIEDKESAPIWISVFSRNKLKIIRNEMMIKNLTTFHGIYPISTDSKDINVFFCYLQTPIAQKILRLNKREYGEGLDKFEPNDINNAWILDFSIISKKDIDKIISIYDNYKINNLLDVDSLNEIFTSYIISE